MPISVTKLRARIQRNRRPKGVEAPRYLEEVWVRYAANEGVRMQRASWAELEPAIRGLTPSTTQDFSLLDALERAKQRFLDLDNLKVRADQIFSRVDRLNRQAFRVMLKRAIGVSVDDILDTELSRQAVVQSINDSIDLIKTVNAEHFDIFKRTILQGITNGTDFHSLKKLVMSKAGAGYPKWKATRIARDQYLKLNGKINEVRQGSIGVTHYFWRTAGDNRTRDSHRENEGERFAWNDPPATGHPGTEIQCRCIADPDLSTAGPKLISNALWEDISAARFGPSVGG